MAVADEIEFAPPGTAADLEEGLSFTPKFGSDGLITCVTTDYTSGDLLMVAHMDAAALRQTVKTGEAHYYSRSRKKLWRKGESSGHVQRVKEMLVDCDQDAIWLKVEQVGPGACHTGRRSCFYRAVTKDARGGITLEWHDAERTFDPHQAYKK